MHSTERLSSITVISITSSSVGVRTIAISVRACLFVCLSVWLSGSMSKKAHAKISPNFRCMLHVAVARSFNVLVHCVLPVLWTTLCFHVIERIGQIKKSKMMRMFLLFRQVAAPVWRQTTLFARYGSGRQTEIQWRGSSFYVRDPFCGSKHRQKFGLFRSLYAMSPAPTSLCRSCNITIVNLYQYLRMKLSVTLLATQ